MIAESGRAGSGFRRGGRGNFSGMRVSEDWVADWSQRSVVEGLVPGRRVQQTGCYRNGFSRVAPEAVKSAVLRVTRVNW